MYVEIIPTIIFLSMLLLFVGLVVYTVLFTRNLYKKLVKEMKAHSETKESLSFEKFKLEMVGGELIDLIQKYTSYRNSHPYTKEDVEKSIQEAFETVTKEKQDHEGDQQDRG